MTEIAIDLFTLFPWAPGYVSVDKKKKSSFGGRRGRGMGFELCIVLQIYHFVGKWKHTCHKGMWYAIPSYSVYRFCHVLEAGALLFYSL